MDGTNPYILVIDDKPDEISSGIVANLEDDAQVTVLHPDDIESTHLQRANLVLVDYRLEEWPKRDNQASVAFKLKSGLSLAVVLREYIDNVNATDKTVAFALHTAYLQELRGWLPELTAEHVLASLNNLEWVFPKTGPRRFAQMVILAKAVQSLQRQWPQNVGDFTKSMKNLLKLDEAARWADRCWNDVRDCRIPNFEMPGRSYRIQFIRWMLHQVMPYPCFLWERHWVAARLHISLNSLGRVVNGHSQLAIDLEEMRYKGELADFLGHRWWRGALEDYVWNLTNGNMTNKNLLDSLNERADEYLESIEPNPAIVSLDENFRPKDEFTTPLEAVRIQPDHWPASADTAWMEIKDVIRQPASLAIVDPLDFAIINSDSDES